MRRRIPTLTCTYILLSNRDNLRAPNCHTWPLGGSSIAISRLGSKGNKYCWNIGWGSPNFAYFSSNMYRHSTPFSHKKNVFFVRFFRLFSVPAVCDCEITVRTGLKLTIIRHNCGRNQEKPVKPQKNRTKSICFCAKKEWNDGTYDVDQNAMNKNRNKSGKKGLKMCKSTAKKVVKR